MTVNRLLLLPAAVTAYSASMLAFALRYTLLPFFLYALLCLLILYCAQRVRLLLVTLLVMMAASIFSIPYASYVVDRSPETRRYLSLVADFLVLRQRMALFMKDHGRCPVDLQELGVSPPDPFGGGSLVFEIDGQSCVVRSVGFDGVDDRGAVEAKFDAIRGGASYFPLANVPFGRLFGTEGADRGDFWLVCNASGCRDNLITSFR